MSRKVKQLGFVLLTLAMPLIAFAEEAHEAHGEHHAGWDTTSLIASFVNFFVLLMVFIFLFRDSLSKYLKDRKAQVEQQLNEAARLKAEAEAKHKEYSERLAKLDQELDQIKKEMIAAGTKERDRIVAEAEQKAARMRKEAEFIVEQQVKQLRTDLAREAAEQAISAAEQLLAKATTSYDQQRLAQEYLAALQKTDSTAPKAAAQTETRV